MINYQKCKFQENQVKRLNKKHFLFLYVNLLKAFSKVKNLPEAWFGEKEPSLQLQEKIKMEKLERIVQATAAFLEVFIGEKSSGMAEMKALCDQILWWEWELFLRLLGKEDFYLLFFDTDQDLEDDKK